MSTTLVAYIACCVALIIIDGMAVYYNHTFLIRFGIHSPYFLRMGKEQCLDSFEIVQNLYRRWYEYDYPEKKLGRIIVLGEEEITGESEKDYILREYDNRKRINRTDMIKLFWWFPYLFFLLGLLLIYPLLPTTPIVYRVVLPSLALMLSFGTSTCFLIGWGHITHAWGAIYAVGLFFIALMDMEAPQLFSKVFDPAWSQFGTFVLGLGALLGGTVWAMMSSLFGSTYLDFGQIMCRV